MFSIVVDCTRRLTLTIRPYERFLLERSWFFLFLFSVFTAKTEEFCVPRCKGQIRKRLETTELSLFSTFPSLNFLTFFLRLLASALLGTFLLCGNAWDNIVKRVIDNPD